MESHLLPAMNALSPCVDLAMSMKEEREIKLALNAKLGSSVSKVAVLSNSPLLICGFPNSG